METGFYYLNARYYDPQVRRFISADDRVIKTGETTRGYNLYAYCQNMPLGMADYDGHCIEIAVALELIETLILAAAVTAIWYSVVKPNEFKKVVDDGVAAAVDATNKITRVYTVYTLSDSEGVVQYVGRTKNYNNRMKQHEKSEDKKGLYPNKIGENLTYPEARGLEQAAMLYYHTHKSEGGLNKINGVDPRKKTKAEIYMKAADGVAGYITNQISNEVLNWLGM